MSVADVGELIVERLPLVGCEQLGVIDKQLKLPLLGYHGHRLACSLGPAGHCRHGPAEALAALEHLFEIINNKPEINICAFIDRFGVVYAAQNEPLDVLGDDIVRLTRDIEAAVAV